MPYETVRDILERIKAFHRRLSDYYQQSKSAAANERVALLLDYMGRHERLIDRCVAKYEKQGSHTVLDTWIQYIPDLSLREAFEEARLEPDMPVEEVFAQAMKLDSVLLAFYEQLASYSAAPKLQELFEDLLAMEKTKETEYARSLLRAQ